MGKMSEMVAMGAGWVLLPIKSPFGTPVEQCCADLVPAAENRNVS